VLVLFRIGGEGFTIAEVLSSREDMLVDGIAV
jgi:hypothetical protein